MDQVDITVVIAPQHHGESVRMALSHLEQQTHPAGKFEILVVNTRHDRKVVNVVESFAEGTPVRVRVIDVPGLSMPPALNRAIDQASGRWLLFLDEDLLAASDCVEAHVRTQEKNGATCAVLGQIRRHTQVANGTFMKRFWWDPTWAPSTSMPVLFLDWHMYNLNLPRRSVMEIGGFDEEYGEAGMWDIDLAWRLAEKRHMGLFMPAASALTWQPTSLERECQRHYADGYGLRRLLIQTGSPQLAARYAPVLSAWQRSADVAWSPVAQRLCRALACDTPLFDAMCRRLMRYELGLGYRDAVAGRPVRPR